MHSESREKVPRKRHLSATVKKENEKGAKEKKEA